MTLFGQSNPSGRLPVTVPRCIGQIPFHYSQKEINFKKRYLFLKEGPRYPFGYGLSYTAFHYSNLTLSKKEVANGDSLEASITLSNTGDRRGKEVVQLYIQDLHGSVVRPAKELKAFRKVDLQPGQKKTLSFTIEPEMLAMTGLDMVRAVENGSFVVQIGPNSAEGLTETFTVILRA